MLVPIQIYKYVWYILLFFKLSWPYVWILSQCAHWHFCLQFLPLSVHPGHFCQIHFPRINYFLPSLFLRKTTNSQWLIRQNTIHQSWNSELPTQRHSQYYSRFSKTSSFNQALLPCSLLLSTPLCFSFFISFHLSPLGGCGMHLLVQSLLSDVPELTPTLNIPLSCGWKVLISHTLSLKPQNHDILVRLSILPFLCDLLSFPPTFFDLVGPTFITPL